MLNIVFFHFLFLGTEIVKPYTPVSASLASKFKDPSQNDRRRIFFMIKIYPSGLFTPVLDSLQIGKLLVFFL